MWIPPAGGPRGLRPRREGCARRRRVGMGAGPPAGHRASARGPPRGPGGRAGPRRPGSGRDIRRVEALRPRSGVLLLRV